MLATGRRGITPGRQWSGRGGVGLGLRRPRVTAPFAKAARLQGVARSERAPHTSKSFQTLFGGGRLCYDCRLSPAAPRRKGKIVIQIIRLLLIASLINCDFGGSASSQTSFEYGKPEEMKGLTKVFISTGSDLKLRREVLKEFEKRKAAEDGLVLVDRYEDAEILLVLSTKYDGNLTRGHGYVARPVGENRHRLLTEFNSARALKIGKSTAGRFVESFMKLYRQVNSGTH